MTDFESLVNRLMLELQNPNTQDKLYVVLGIVLAYVVTKVGVALGKGAFNKIRNRNTPSPFVQSVVKEMDACPFYVEKENYIACKTYRVYPQDKRKILLVSQYANESQRQDLTHLLSHREHKLLHYKALENITRIQEANKEATRVLYLKRHENQHT